MSSAPDGSDLGSGRPVSLVPSVADFEEVRGRASLFPEIKDCIRPNAKLILKYF